MSRKLFDFFYSSYFEFKEQCKINQVPTIYFQIWQHNRSVHSSSWWRWRVLFLHICVASDWWIWNALTCTSTVASSVQHIRIIVTTVMVIMLQDPAMLLWMLLLVTWFLLFIIYGGGRSFLLGHWYPCFGLSGGVSSWFTEVNGFIPLLLK